ncbi:MAG: Crp/Fnr family transcriptional regulator [Bacteroidota bacterium]
MDRFYTVFHDHFPFLTEDDIYQLKDHAGILHLQKKESWHHGQYQYKVGFIAEGALRAFFIDQAGKEITTIIKTDGQTMVLPGAAQRGYGKTYFSQAILPSTLIEIPLPSLLMLCQQNSRIFQFFMLNIVDHLNALMERVEHLISLKPEERVAYLTQHKQDFVERIPQKYLADFIGITPVSFSRLLKKLSED